MFELYHHGVKGQKWGMRRWQYEDGSLTPAGREHYNIGQERTNLSNIYGDKKHIWDEQDYIVPKGTILSRRSTKKLDKLIDEYRPYSYVYDDNNQRDDDFYSQFGKEKNQFRVQEDLKVAGMKAIAKSFDEAIFNKSIDDIDPTTYKWLDLHLKDTSNGKLSLTSYKWDASKTPEENRKEYESIFSKAASRTVARAAGARRNDDLDRERIEYDGKRDPDTALNDFFLNISSDLLSKNYSAIRDYKDAGGNAGVVTPTIFFDDNILTRKISDL